MLTVEQLRAQVGRGEVHEVVLALPDLTGRLQGTRLGARHFLDSVVADGFGACTYLLTTDVDMAVVAPTPTLDPEGTGYGDMLLRPDLSSLRPLPWDPGTVQVVADAELADGTPVPVAPRQALRVQVEALAAHGLVPYAGVELELRAFTTSYAAAQQAGWRDLSAATRFGVDYALVGLEGMERLTRRLRREMTEAGLVLESARAECAPGQYEIVFRYDEALRAADDAAFYRTGARQIAAQEGQAVTFMPKYDAGEGNSCHLHVSLRDQHGEPALAGDGVHGESALLRRTLAGQLACLRELTLLFAPTVNAYKRLRPGAFAPTVVAWGRDNRLAALRLVGHGPSLRVENRVPGATPIRTSLSPVSCSRCVTGSRPTCPFPTRSAARRRPGPRRYRRRSARPPTCSRTARSRARGWATPSSTPWSPPPARRSSPRRRTSPSGSARAASSAGNEVTVRRRRGGAGSRGLHDDPVNDPLGRARRAGVGGRAGHPERAAR